MVERNLLLVEQHIGRLSFDDARCVFEQALVWSIPSLEDFLKDHSALACGQLVIKEGRELVDLVTREQGPALQDRGVLSAQNSLVDLVVRVVSVGAR